MDRKQVLGWSMYDFANTMFSALFVTVYFPLFVGLKGGTPFHVGLVMGISMLIAGFVVPLLGAVADQTKQKKKLLFIFTTICCAATFLTGFSSLGWVLLLAMLANFSYHASLDMYDALLVDVSTAKNRGWVSGLGTAIGYGGTILSVGIAYLVGMMYGFESLKSIVIIFVLTALLYYGFSMFTFFLVRAKPKAEIELKHFKNGAKEVWSTIRDVRKYKSVWLFLLSSFLYTDGANTAIIFLFLFAQDQLQLGLMQFLPIYVLMAVTAGLGSLLFGKIADKISHKKALMWILLLWTLVVLLLFVWTNFFTFMLVGLGGGALLGGMWTVTRPLLVQLAPKNKVAELLGYQGLTEKFSGVIGPVLFGFLATVWGFREALLVVIVLFILGAIVLHKVK